MPGMRACKFVWSSRVGPLRSAVLIVGGIIRVEEPGTCHVLTLGESQLMPDKPYILGVCGWSDSGKTALIEAVLLRLCKTGLRIAVVKHDVHGLNIDHPGKDSDRFFQAGADVFLQGPQEEVLRLHGSVGQE